MQTTYRGDTWQFNVKSESASGVPTDFTGSIIQFTLGVTPSPITELSVGVSLIVTLGQISITITDEVMDGVKAGVYPYSVRVIFGDGTERTLFKQSVLVQEGVPR